MEAKNHGMFSLTSYRIVRPIQSESEKVIPSMKYEQILSLIKMERGKHYYISKVSHFWL